MIKPWQLKPGALSFIPNNCQHFTHNMTLLFTNLSIIEGIKTNREARSYHYLVHTYDDSCTYRHYLQDSFSNGSWTCNRHRDTLRLGSLIKEGTIATTYGEILMEFQYTAAGYPLAS